MHDVTAWYEHVLHTAKLPPTEQPEALYRMLQELVAIAASRWGIPAELSLEAQLHLVNAHSGLPLHLAEAIAGAVRRLGVLRRRPVAADEEQLSTLRAVFVQWLASLSGEPPPEALRSELPREPAVRTEQAANSTEFRLIVLRWDAGTPGKPPRIVGRHEWGMPVTVLLFPPWESLPELLWCGATLGIVGARPLRPPTLWAVGEQALVVIEPDRLVDVTDVAAACRSDEAPQEWVLRRLSGEPSSESLVTGWLLNCCFDEAVAGSGGISAAAVVRRAWMQRPLSLLALEMDTADLPERLQRLAATCARHLPMVHRVAALLRQQPLVVEPFFLSPRYGLQGRLDVLTLTEEAAPDILVELKAGTPPRGPVWREHRAQVVCYDLLLRSALGTSARRCWLFYCRDQATPLRDIRPRTPDHQWVLQQRNRLVSAEWRLASGEETLGTLLRRLDTPEAHAWRQAYETLCPEEQAYVEELCRFLVREHWATARNLLTTASSSEAGLSFLRLDEEATDWQRLHLCLRRTGQTALSTALRPGDTVILAPLSADGEPLLFAAPVLKGTLRRLEEELLWVSLRNKYVEPQWCRRWQWWAVYPDATDQLIEAQWAALGRFLKASPRQRQRWLGMLPPRQLPQEVWEEQLPEGLAPEQCAVLAMALSARDYALIQGPPGTGKTSVVIGTLAALLSRQPEETLLLMAYTNRAVDELCRTLTRAGIPFVRLGTREVTEFPDALLSSAAERMAPNEYADWLRQSRVVVGTVASVLTTPELLTVKRFTTVIVDEASQLLESHLIGLLCTVGRAILVGDERQLPAVLRLSAEQATVCNEELRRLGFRSFADSVFERLLRQCLQNGWEHAFGMLSRQARMHRILQHFPSAAFYNGKLSTAGLPHQEAEQLPFPEPPRTPVEHTLARHRLVFVDVPPQPGAYRYHAAEAEVVAQIVEALARLWGTELTEQSIGVITPYRLQASYIVRRLPPTLRRYVTVDTVERFQGSERECIVISLAVNHPWELRFVQSSVLVPDGTVVDRRLNVMLTRARQQLVLIGAAEIARCSPLYRRLLAAIARSGALVPAAELSTLVPIQPSTLP